MTLAYARPGLPGRSERRRATNAEARHEPRQPNKKTETQETGFHATRQLFKPALSRQRHGSRVEYAHRGAYRRAVRAVQGDSPERRGGRLRAVEDRHRPDEGIPGGERPS